MDEQDQGVGVSSQLLGSSAKGWGLGAGGQKRPAGTGVLTLHIYAGFYFLDA